MHPLSYSFSYICHVDKLLSDKKKKEDKLVLFGLGNMNKMYPCSYLMSVRLTHNDFYPFWLYWTLLLTASCH